jgi:hypothetical protein
MYRQARLSVASPGFTKTGLLLEASRLSRADEHTIFSKLD